MILNKECYIYGVISEKDSDAFLPFTTESGDEIHLVNYNGIGGVVTNAIRKDYLTMEKEGIAQDLVAHQTVIEKLMKDHTIIPLKFGTYFQDHTEVVEILKKGEGLFNELLKTMKGKIELDVVAIWNDLNSVIKGIGESNQEILNFKQEIAKNPPEDIFQAGLQVGAMVKTALDEKRKGLQEEVTGRLRGLSVDHQTHDLMEDKMILNCAFLIPGDREGLFDKVLHELDREYEGTINFRCVGPLPPYSFATCEVKSLDFMEIDRARQLLELKDKANMTDIKSAYRNYIKTKHPDKSDDVEAQRQFEEVKSAYKTLLDLCPEGEISFRPEDINGKFIVRRFDVAGTRTFNR